MDAQGAIDPTSDGKMRDRTALVSVPASAQSAVMTSEPTTAERRNTESTSKDTG